MQVLKGYGISCGEQVIQGIWGYEESKLHINVLELLAIKIGIECFFKTNI